MGGYPPPPHPNAPWLSNSGLSQVSDKRRPMSRFALTLLPLLLAAPLHAQKKTTKPKPPAAAKPTPLSQRDRTQQLLNRFTFGPRPAGVQQVLALTPEKSLEQQLNP